MSNYITVACPHESCEAEIELECEYEPADPEVGIMSGGLVAPNAPDECPVCHLVYTLEQKESLERQIIKAVDRWTPPERDYEPEDREFDDRWDGPAADRAADDYFNR
jgi:hypothetical protein